MPRKKRQSKQRPRPLTFAQEMELAFSTLTAHPENWENDFLRRRDYFLHRDEINEFITCPGMRSGGWWRYEAPGQREVIGREEIFEPYSRKPARVKCICGEEHIGYACVFEKDEDALRRLGLLEEREAAEIAANKLMRERT